jgi:hypothetical protein
MSNIIRIISSHKYIMIYIYGDSHAHYSFKNLKVPHNNLWKPSITMHRIGRDNHIINFINKENVQNNDIIILAYGEVDCRCHIQRQVDMGRNEDDIINELVTNYTKTIKNNITAANVNVIIVGVIPPTKQTDYERHHGPITHEFPFVGSDDDRVRYTSKVNNSLEAAAKNNKYIYFNPYSYYTRDDGTLKYELSDLNVHLGDNSEFLKRFNDLYETIPRPLANTQMYTMNLFGRRRLR